MTKGYKKINIFKNAMLPIVVMLFVSIFGFTSKAVTYSVQPTTGILYSGKGAELFAEPDVMTALTVIPQDIPILVTGTTDNGFFQVVIDNQIRYMYYNALSAQTGTIAETLTYRNAKAAIVADADTGEILYDQDSQVSLPPASTTKIMTALLTLEAIQRGEIALDTGVMISKTALSGIPSDASHVSPRLKAGEFLNILGLLECVMIKSDCHACNVLAEAVAGNVDNFVALMNERARQLGCTGTNFVNTSGYPNDKHVTNAYSLYLITREAMKYDTFRTIVGLKSVELPATNLSKARTLENTNLLMIDSKYYNPYVTGVKTGSAQSSGLCLVTSATKGNRNIIVVVLGASSGKLCNGELVKGQFYETNKLVAFGLAN